jgi:hypothetical protein
LAVRCHRKELMKVFPLSSKRWVRQLAFELDGTIISVIQIIALILLTIGVYPYRIRTKNRNLIMHGFLSITALALNLFTVFYAMLPIFNSMLRTLSGFSLSVVAIMIHAGLGLVAIVLGFVIIVSWVTHPLGELGCSKTWKLMIPTFAIWTATLVIGLITHFFAFV